MAVVYLDSSALVKLLVEEEGSKTAAALWDGADAVVSSRLAEVEVRAALAAARRGRRLDASAWSATHDRWVVLSSGLRRVELTASLADRAGALAARHGLRGADAVHLASALAVDGGDLLVAVWDVRLAERAREVGLHVVP